MKKAYVISDKDYRTDAFEQLHNTILSYLREKGFETEEARIGEGDLAFCMGCFGCWIKKPGECVIGDGVSEINRVSMSSDAVIYLCPVLFGQFSANIKNAIDRWLPNMLPFFTVRADGSTMHPPRYGDYPMQIMIGYGENLSDEDAGLFADITKKHRSNAEVLILRGSANDAIAELDKIRLERTGGQL